MKAARKKLGLGRSLLLALAVNAPVWAAERGEAAPQCRLSAFQNGQAIDLQRLKGKVLYVDFWASWCGPCAQSFPFMNALTHEFHGRGLEIIGVNVDEDVADAKGFLAQRPGHFTVAVDGDKSCAERFGVKAMPSTYLIDRNGVIRYVHLGFRPGEAEEMKKLLGQLLAEKPAAASMDHGIVSASK
ncbi:TlpA family protein disulfide reductase [Methylotetracoccus oryzae]|uniref:TlpA family protein disulfide reductase n=1 Tax=Methylotetracoccus oryzae TaxID=1919059 RepID=UPI0011181B93|nr:TlpA disulfide reductase family protein [Methylotetracoccus oryzae]